MDRITRIAPSARLQQQIEELLTNGLGEQRERLAELGRLGARLVLQQAVDEEVAAFLGRARYERTLAATGSRNGTRPKPIQTAEGEISIAIPQVRNTAEEDVGDVRPSISDGDEVRACGVRDGEQLSGRRSRAGSDLSLRLQPVAPQSVDCRIDQLPGLLLAFQVYGRWYRPARFPISMTWA